MTGTQGETAAAGAVREARSFWPQPIGTFLVALVAVVLVPTLIFSVYLLDRTSRAQQDVVRTLAEATAGSIAETVERELTSMITTLRVISTANSLGTGDMAEFYLRARAALLNSNMYLIVADEEMNQIINTRVAFGTPLQTISDVEPVQRAMRSGDPVVSNGFYGRTAQRWVFNAILPWSATGQNIGLILTRDADDLQPALASQNLRGGWNAALIDGAGSVLATSYLSSDIGKPFFLLGQEPGGDPLPSEIRHEGTEYQTVTKPLRHGGWRVVMWAPAAAFEAPLRRSMLVLALGALGMAMMGAGGAWLLGRQIAKPVRRLAQDARLVGAGETVEAVDYPVAEIAIVSQALAQAARDRQEAENEIRFLMREVAHRSKNQLTVVSSIAKQTARNSRSFDDFQDAFQKRLHGLARSTDLLIDGGVAGVEIRALVEAQIEPFRPQDPDRIDISGPEFRLSNQAAQTIGMGIHELATNAAKYGAFSKSGGRLTVHWAVVEDRLEFHWREHVSRLRRKTDTRGFGTEVIERMLGGTLDAEIERELASSGLSIRFRMPLERIASDAPASS